MMKKIIKNVARFLPLHIDSVEWNDPNLILIGKDWSFSTIGCWRLIDHNKLECGCYDEESIISIQKIKNLSIVAIDIQSTQLSVDPVFTFSNGYKLEVFSTTFLEPWIFDFSSDVVYVASPSDDKEV
ncbi:hypothetical protein [Candidatus Protochlamydia phocaeensis]|uniref:hypothetical protein n=1 Tax=Candidatus Protochlamydia phocaeensis TaxID=1414722 RepID=UPI0008381EBD|nr:hypothetical protein [Candidatus Protochlamydia phocaeensis]